MQSRVRDAAVAALAALTLALAAGSSAAGELTFHPGGGETLTSLGNLTLSGGAINVTCAATLTGRLATESITTTSGSALGELSSGSSSGCSGGELSLLMERPWSWTYQSTEGTYPESLTALTTTLTGVSIQARVIIFGIAITCVYGGSLELRTSLGAPNAYEVGLEAIQTNSLPRTGGASSCPSAAALSGTLALGEAQLAAAGPQGVVWFPANLEFGGVPVNETRISTVTFWNRTGGPITLREIRIGNEPIFTYDKTLLREREIFQDEQERSIRITFRPGSPGAMVTALTIVTTAPKRYAVNIRGRGT